MSRFPLSSSDPAIGCDLADLESAHPVKYSPPDVLDETPIQLRTRLSNYPKTLSSPGFYAGYTPFSDSYLRQNEPEHRLEVRLFKVRAVLVRPLPLLHFDAVPASGSTTYRATFGGALASRELWFGRSGSDRDLSLHCGLVTRVSGRTPFGAYCPKRSLAREASTLSLATCLPGFPGMVGIPLGRLSTSPIPLWARVALWFHHLHLRAGYIHARRLRGSLET